MSLGGCHIRSNESEGKGNCSPSAELRDGDAGHCRCGSTGILKTMLTFVGEFMNKGLSDGLSIVGMERLSPSDIHHIHPHNSTHI